MQIVQEFDAAQLESLFTKHYHDLARYAHSIVKQQDEAEDVVQQLFVKLWDKRDELPLLENPAAYLYRATYNASVNARKRMLRQNPDSEVYVSAAGTGAASDRLLSAELEARIEAAMQSLPEKCQEVFRLSRFNDLSYKEIAEQLDISPKTVENHMGKALRIMREELSDYLPQIVITLLLSMKW